MGTTLAKKIHDWWLHGHKTRTRQLAAEYATTNIVVTFLYILFIVILGFLFVSIIPKIGIEIEKLAISAPKLADAWKDLIMRIETNIGLDLWVKDMFSDIISTTNIESMWQTALIYIRDAWAILIKFMMGLLLSYIFIIERWKITNFVKLIKDGNFDFLYREYHIISLKIARGFGLIFKAQSIIALVNAILTTIWLYVIWIIMWGSGFPYIFTLSLIVFILGFIPIFGTLISSVPIILIGYGYGWTDIVISITIMILIIHAIEAYILNPKIVSSYVHFPVFITFLVLIISEHLFGLVWLLIWVPMFSIFLGLFQDFDNYITEVKKSIHEKWD
jgi:predicted PurR-regulated permease PerM